MYSYYLKIAEVLIFIESTVEIDFQPCMIPFLTEPFDKSNFLYMIELVDTKIVHEHTIKFKKEDFQICVGKNSLIRQRSVWNREKQKNIYMNINKENGQNQMVIPTDFVRNGRIFTDVNILNFLALEEPLLSNNAFILHSSFISWQGKGIVFTAPSGTGKSTQADLWHEYEGAEIYNGDRTIIRKIDNVYHGFGSPYAGSSGIYRNETAPIKAIIVLTQAPENRIERLTGKQAFTPLYKETLMNTWNPEYMNKMTDLLMDVAAKIPIYHLACRPDREAVELVKKTLFQE